MASLIILHKWKFLKLDLKYFFISVSMKYFKDLDSNDLISKEQMNKIKWKQIKINRNFFKIRIEAFTSHLCQ